MQWNCLGCVLCIVLSTCCGGVTGLNWVTDNSQGEGGGDTDTSGSARQSMDPPFACSAITEDSLLDIEFKADTIQAIYIRQELPVTKQFSYCRRLLIIYY